MAPPQNENTTPLVKKQNAAREVVDVLHEISTLLVSYPFRADTRFLRLVSRYACHRKRSNTSKNTGLDRNQLSMCISMVENGVNPEALAVSGHKSQDPKR